LQHPRGIIALRPSGGLRSGGGTTARLLETVPWPFEAQPSNLPSHDSWRFGRLRAAAEVPTGATVPKQGKDS